MQGDQTLTNNIDIFLSGRLVDRFPGSLSARARAGELLT